MLPPLKHLWTREKPDGKQGWGVLRFLILGALLTAGFFMFVFSVDTKQAERRAASIMGSKPKANPVVSDVQIGGVAASAQATEQINLKKPKEAPLGGSQLGMSVQQEPGAEGDNGSSATNDTFGSGFKAPSGAKAQSADEQTHANDSIFSALAQSEQPESNDGRPVIDEGGAAKGAKGRNPFPDNHVSGGASTADNNRPPPVPSIQSLIAVDLPALPATAQQNGGQSSGTAGASTSPSNGSRQNANGKPTRWLPRGEFIPVYVLTTVESGKMQAIIRLGVAKNVWFNGQPVLPFGWEFEASAGSVTRDRMQIHIDTLRRRDGVSLSVNAIGCGEDKFTGVPSYYIASPAMVQAAPLIAQFATAYGSIVAQHATLPTITAAGVTASSQTSESQLFKEAGVSALSTALGQFLNGQLNEVQTHYAAYSTLPEGTLCYVQLTQDTDFTPLWDFSNRGQMVTLGKPDVMSTEAVYKALAAAKDPNQNPMAQLAQAITAASKAPPGQAAAAVASALSPSTTQQPAGTTALSPSSQTSTPVSDPFKEAP
jgi:hypothetical protein